jgi:hypothetical protein
MFVLDGAAADTRYNYVWMRTGHYYVDSHSSFDRLLLDLDTFIRLYIKTTCSSDGSGECLFWMKRRRIHGTFACGPVTTTINTAAKPGGRDHPYSTPQPAILHARRTGQYDQHFKATFSSKQVSVIR